MNGGAGKGSKQRPTDKKRFDAEHERLYGIRCRYPHQHTKDCKGVVKWKKYKN